MNTLSWLIYLADIAGSVSVLLTILVFCMFVATAVLLITLGVRQIDPPSIWSHNGPAEVQKAKIEATDNGLRKIWPKTATIAVVAGVIACVIPSKSTIYAIAASQYGEKLAQTETAGKAVKALNAWLDRQIADKPSDDGGK